MSKLSEFLLRFGIIPHVADQTFSQFLNSLNKRPFSSVASLGLKGDHQRPLLFYIKAVSDIANPPLSGNEPSNRAKAALLLIAHNDLYIDNAMLGGDYRAFEYRSVNILKKLGAEAIEGKLLAVHKDCELRRGCFLMMDGLVGVFGMNENYEEPMIHFLERVDAKLLEQENEDKRKNVQENNETIVEKDIGEEEDNDQEENLEQENN